MLFFSRRSFLKEPELYLMLAISFVGLVAHLLLGEPVLSTTTLLLAAFLSFNFTLLRFLQTLKEREATRPGDILLEKYPASYAEDMKRAKTLWMTGTNLRRIFPVHESALETLLENGGTIIAMLALPGSDACRYGALQEYGEITEDTVKEFSHLIELAKGRLRRLRGLAPGRVHVLEIDFPLPFGIDAINVGFKEITDKDGNKYMSAEASPDGIIYLRYYPIKGEDKPIVVLQPHETSLYGFYAKQLSIFSMLAGQRTAAASKP